MSRKKSRQVDSLPKGTDARPSEDWMDFNEKGGGSKRHAVGGGPRELESERK